MFDEACLNAFKCLKERLNLTPITVSLDWALPFDFLYKANGEALVAVL